ncbi:MAG: SMP-30/gluconolactonase/LRE family protein [Desulfomonilaceae bacterium]
MIKKVLVGLLVAAVMIVAYFAVWPVPIDPRAWRAPANPGYTGAFAPNDRLKDIELLAIAGCHGPEAVALDAQGRIYVTTHEGFIVRLDPNGTNAEKWADTKGRPLGIDFDAKGNLIVADAFRGLLSVSTDAAVTELAAIADGIPIRYADDVSVAADGRIYFSDASTKFGAKEYGGTMEASLLDIMEHGGHGRLLCYDPASGKTTTLLSGLNFANGVAVSHDQQYLLVNETGSYRILRYWLDGPKKGSSEVLIEGLPGFPDNITGGHDGRFWVALVSPRNKLLDSLSEKPFLRKVVQRMPKFLRPKAAAYGHIIAIDGNGKVLQDLQDPHTAYPQNTSVRESNEYLYIGSLVAPALARLPKAKAGIQGGLRPFPRKAEKSDALR